MMCLYLKVIGRKIWGVVEEFIVLGMNDPNLKRRGASPTQ
jgi:hypothetical protein